MALLPEAHTHSFDSPFVSRVLNILATRILLTTVRQENAVSYENHAIETAHVELGIEERAILVTTTCGYIHMECGNKNPWANSPHLSPLLTCRSPRHRDHSRCP